MVCPALLSCRNPRKGSGLGLPLTAPRLPHHVALHGVPGSAAVTGTCGDSKFAFPSLFYVSTCKWHHLKGQNTFENPSYQGSIDLKPLSEASMLRFIVSIWRHSEVQVHGILTWFLTLSEQNTRREGRVRGRSTRLCRAEEEAKEVAGGWEVEREDQRVTERQNEITRQNATVEHRRRPQNQRDSCHREQWSWLDKHWVSVLIRHV